MNSYEFPFTVFTSMSESSSHKNTIDDISIVIEEVHFRFYGNTWNNVHLEFSVYLSKQNNEPHYEICRNRRTPMNLNKSLVSSPEVPPLH